MSSRKHSRTFAQGAGYVIAALVFAPIFATPALSVNDAYRPPDESYGSAPQEIYRPAPAPGQYPSNDSYEPGNTYSPEYGSSVPPAAGYGEPYTPPSANDGLPDPKGPGEVDSAASSGYDKNEIISAGHQLFGGVSKGLADAVEWAFQSQGRPNGYIVGEDAGGAFVVGLRYGEGTLHSKLYGSQKVFWQGPSVGYDAGAEGSKTMVLIYNMSDPSEIYERFGGVQGAAYLVGGVGVQVQKHGNVTLAVIRSGVGLRLGANVGYMKYTRSPTWNPL
ncbi:MAG: DUF1134 domain-containing protein [Hyphomicrobium sp.]|nr:DUF1134 domain-containing protein [Hyphomicrobium sp.]